MFRYSIDEFIASKQKEKSLGLLEELMKHSVLEHCPQIEKFFDENVRSYEFLEELPDICNKNDHPIVMPCIPRDGSEYHAKMELKVGYDKLLKSWRDPIPFIEFSFPENYKCKHGDEYKHVYIFFFTQFKGFDGARDGTLYYLNKLNNLKAFLWKYILSAPILQAKQLAPATSQRSIKFPWLQK